MNLDEASGIPFYQQIFDHFRIGIEVGRYPAGSKLPSIRGLAADLGCSRNTVEAAYRQLVQEGFVESRPGSGYVIQDASFLQASPVSFTSSASSAASEIASGASVASGNDAAKQSGGLSATRGAAAPEAPASAREVMPRFDFTYGNLQPGTFPSTSWRSITDDILLSIESKAADSYNDPQGETPLRSEIAWRIGALRSINCEPDQVIIQAGTQASVQNLLCLFDSTTDTIAMENPGYDGVRRVFERSHFSVAPCRVDSGGHNFLADIEASGARLVYVTPSSQFPTCRVMPLDTRQALIAWAHEHDAYILEDDYCRSFRYRDKPVLPLRSIDEEGRVIYMGTFSKSLSPALRMNYLVLPPALLARWNELFADAYSAVPWLSQAVLARFMSSGMWDRHLRRLQARNRRKYELITNALRTHMDAHVELMENGTGLHLLVRVLDGRSEDELIDAARAAGVRVYGTSRYWMRTQDAPRGCMLIGFSAIAEEDIAPGIEALAKAWFASA